MKKMILSLVALMTAMSMNAQVVDVYQGTDANTPTATYTHTSTNKVKVNFKKGTDGEQVVITNGSETVTYNNTSEKPLKVVFHPATDEINGHKYVEIGGIKWATMNVGATTVADDAATAYGDYYAWGETATYYSNISWSGSTPTVTWKTGSDTDGTHQTGNKSNGYVGANYSTYSSYTITEWSPAPYSSSSYTLESTYDVATKEWKSPWRMPTAKEFQSLFTACGGSATSTTTITGDLTTIQGNVTKFSGSNITAKGIYVLDANTTVDGTAYKVAGVLFVADDKDTSKRVFFPMAGNYKGSYTSSLCDYWTSSYSQTSVNDALCVYCGSDNTIKIGKKGSRFIGHTVRPVTD